MAILLQRAQTAGAIRPGITASEPIIILKWLFATHHEPDPEQSARPLALLTDGLRPPTC